MASASKHEPTFMGGRVCSVRCSCGWGSDLFIKAHGAWNSYNRHKVIAEHEEGKLESPAIVRTVEELEALDPETVLVTHLGGTWIAGSCFGKDLPAVVLATGDQLRAAGKALEDV